MTKDKPEHIDNGTAPDIFANGAHVVERMGAVARIVFFTWRRGPGGVLYSEPVCNVVVPIDSLPGVVSLLGGSVDQTLATGAAVGASQNKDLH